MPSCCSLKQLSYGKSDARSLASDFFVSFQHQLFDLGDLFPFSDLNTVPQNLLVEWVAVR